MSALRRPRESALRRGRQNADDPLVFAGTASPRLTDAICRELGVARAAGEVVRFSEGTLFVRVLENVRGRSVYLVQSTVFPTNANFMELLFWTDAFSRASADSATVVARRSRASTGARTSACFSATDSGRGGRALETLDLDLAHAQHR